MKQFLAVLGLAFIFISCNKANADVSKLEGTYIGYFHRSGEDTARVSLNFTGGSFQGQSSVTNYPAICNGSVDQNDNTINFTDSCMWPANFDWSLILKGAYNYQDNIDGSIRIWRQNNLVMDEYILRRPIR